MAMNNPSGVSCQWQDAARVAYFDLRLTGTVSGIIAASLVQDGRISGGFRREVWAGRSYLDDVLLIPGESDVLPRDVDTATKLTADRSGIPLMSAGMDM